MARSISEENLQKPLKEGTAEPKNKVKPENKAQSVESFTAQTKGESDTETVGEVWGKVFEKKNLESALKRVERNKGAPGVDGMAAEELRGHLQKHWVEILATLEAGKYRPSPVRRVEIPKPEGGVRELGVPTALDRMIQQAVGQVLTPMFEGIFSEQSYGFRPGRNAQQAVMESQKYIEEGRDWVVDIDLEKFFDRVNHDMLMARVARVLKDKRVLKLVRAYLESGVMINGVVMGVNEGTPQGGPLSPLLSNIMLTDLDMELEARGHKFVRYADDCNIYVKTQKAGERVMESVIKYVEKKLKLRVNRKKSKVEKSTKAKFLGFSFYKRKGKALIRLANRTKERFKEEVRHLTRRSRSGKIEGIIGEVNRYTRGWIGYYRWAKTPSVYEELDEWIRRRLRQTIWKRWKQGTTRYRELVRLGIPPDRAALGAGGKSPWRMSHNSVIHEALSNTYWRNLGFESISERYAALQLRYSH
jgi:RNA-directed DNA polymerase